MPPPWRPSWCRAAQAPDQHLERRPGNPRCPLVQHSPAVSTATATAPGGTKGRVDAWWADSGRAVLGRMTTAVEGIGHASCTFAALGRVCAKLVAVVFRARNLTFSGASEMAAVNLDLVSAVRPQKEWSR